MATSYDLILEKSEARPISHLPYTDQPLAL